MQKRQDVRNEKYRVFGEGGTKRSLPVISITHKRDNILRNDFRQLVGKSDARQTMIYQCGHTF